MLANVNKPSDANVCHANDSYKVKSMRKNRSASKALVLTLKISKTLQQRHKISNSAGCPRTL